MTKGKALSGVVVVLAVAGPIYYCRGSDGVWFRQVAWAVIASEDRGQHAYQRFAPDAPAVELLGCENAALAALQICFALLCKGARASTALLRTLSIGSTQCSICGRKLENYLFSWPAVKPRPYFSLSSHSCCGLPMTSSVSAPLGIG
jgi:hypothetical protein